MNFKVSIMSINDSFCPNCNVCGEEMNSEGDSVREKHEKFRKIFDEQIAYLSRLKVDNYWSNAFACDDGEYYILCANCWLKILRTATAASMLKGMS